MPSTSQSSGKPDPSLYLVGSNQAPVLDIVIGAAFQVQQITGVYNNALMTSLAVQQGCKDLGIQSDIAIGHLGPNSAAAAKGISAGIMHAWVVTEGNFIVDATLLDGVPPEETIKAKQQLVYRSGPPTTSIPGLPLPFTWEMMEQPDRYLEACKTSPENSSAWLAYHGLYTGLVSGLKPLQEDLRPLVEALHQQAQEGSTSGSAAQ